MLVEMIRSSLVHRSFSDLLLLVVLPFEKSIEENFLFLQKPNVTWIARRSALDN